MITSYALLKKRTFAQCWILTILDFQCPQSLTRGNRCCHNWKILAKLEHKLIHGSCNCYWRKPRANTYSLATTTSTLPISSKPQYSSFLVFQNSTNMTGARQHVQFSATRSGITDKCYVYLVF